MATIRKTLRTGIAAVLLFAGSTPGAYAQVAGGSSSFGGASPGLTEFTGKVVCVGCNLEKVRHVHPSQNDFYQLLHRQGQIVIEVTAVADPQL